MIGRPPRHYLQIEVQRVDFPRIMIMLKVRNYGPNAVARVLGCYHTTAINWGRRRRTRLPLRRGANKAIPADIPGLFSADACTGNYDV
jgi:hypothetical protein